MVTRIFVNTVFKTRNQGENGAAGREAGRTIVRAVLGFTALATLGCTSPTPGKAASAQSGAEETCEVLYKDSPERVITYSRVTRGEGYTQRIDICQPPDFAVQPYDSERIPLQVDEYTWDLDAGRWILTEGSPRIEIGSCASFTQGTSIGAAALIEQLLCSDSVPPREDFAIFQKISHDESYGCWTCFNQSDTVWIGTNGRSVWCQVPGYDVEDNWRVHLDTYRRLDFSMHWFTYDCPNLLGLTPEQVDKICGDPLPTLPDCGK